MAERAPDAGHDHRGGDQAYHRVQPGQPNHSASALAVMSHRKARIAAITQPLAV